MPGQKAFMWELQATENENFICEPNSGGINGTAGSTQIYVLSMQANSLTQMMQYWRP